MSKSPALSEFQPPRRVAAELPADVSGILPRIVRLGGGASPRPDATETNPRPTPLQEPYFEIYRAERVSLTSILFSGGDWRWRFCSPSGRPIAVSAGYPNERECAAAVAALQSGAGAARVRVGNMR